MSGAFLILAGRRSTCSWQGCRVAYLYKNATKDLRAHSVARYCVSVNGQDKPLSQGKEYKDVENKSLHVRLKELAEQNPFGGKHVKGLRINREAIIQKRVERLYPQAKSSLLSIYAVVGHELGDPAVLTSSVKNITANKTKRWEVAFNVRWPEVMSFKETGKTKALASKNAAMKCLQWLEMNNKLNNGKPIVYDKEVMRDMQHKPVELNVTPEMLNSMSDLIKTYDTEIRSLALQQRSFSTPRVLHQTRTDVHPILGPNTHTDTFHRNELLKGRLLERSIDDAVTLPIHEFKDEILSKLESNRVLLVEGDTGCGKTTQVPQFIFDTFAGNGNATDCNILISQPRRISAISLADRIAYERAENVGDVVGFHVRLEHLLPEQLGTMVFCTTGILLRKLQSNPGLVGCSHVILDEAHERQIDTDMLMILLKRALKKNPNLKVLIMSATINTHMFQQYFDCPAVRVPGRLYSVKMHFLEDIEHLPNIHKYRTYVNSSRHEDEESDKLSVDFGKMVQLIKWISMHKPPGAILCFLPGWHEITKVQSMLEDTSSYTQKHLILPMHSKVSHNEQRKIFKHTPEGVRKIILATDIAETGITVSDVVYVVDSAIRKESRWNDNKDLPCISNRWVSRANVLQRKGRAGRVKPGESYHLISKKEYEKLEAHPVPQLLCNPLEKVILDSKTYTDEKAEQFLGGFLEPPTSAAIQKALRYLVNLGAMDNEENLTALGKRIAHFTTYPKFSKAMVYSSIFNCVHPVVTIASVFSNEDSLFYDVLNKKSEIRENKRLFHPSSDHMAMAWLFKQWYTHNETSPHLILSFCRKMNLRPLKIQILSQIRNTFIQQLTECRLLDKDMLYYDYSKSNVEANKFENCDELVQAVLYSATQQFIEHQDMGFKNGIVRKGVNKLQTQGRATAVISGESVNYKRKVWPSSFLTYFNAAHCEMRRSTVIRETSMISPLTVLLFSQQRIQYHELDDNRTEIEINVNARHTLRFACDNETADVLLKFRDITWTLVQYLLETQGVSEHRNNFNSKQIIEYKERVFQTLAELLHMSAAPIENIEKAKRISVD
ncbi:PREDICTED: putative ATP-dependent RNA helicase DHX30 isoform X2 [Vollenhovia emeryi]|uniref:putative ATP-dependent RNA helicase DHX30 isoform X2 n=1 Tax=Vollenhovia emeryi TaxID=411798 RepID=UPI0005F438B9|nr:PREDICTED: putative ATP-dependent RNA helicase DHX30 isoform X2 [Vollenhovia emeryi]